MDYFEKQANWEKNTMGYLSFLFGFGTFAPSGSTGKLTI